MKVLTIASLLLTVSVLYSASPAVTQTASAAAITTYSGGSGYVGDISTISGTKGVIGKNVNSTPMAAMSAQYTLSDPCSVIGDPISGSVIVADASRLVNISNGFARSIVGGAMGDVDGPAASAKLGTPTGLRLMDDGTIYFCDAYYNKIKMLKNNVVSTIAGVADGTASLVDGSKTTARFNGPTGLDVGPDGALYVSDRANNAIRRVALDGQTTTLYQVAGLQPKGLKVSNAKEYLIFSSTTGGTDTIYIYFFGNKTTRAIGSIATNILSFDTDSDDNIIFPGIKGVYILFKSRNWERHTIAEGNAGYENGEYPATVAATPRFSSLTAFSRVQGHMYALADGADNYLIRSMTIYPELTPVEWSIRVNVPNIPTWNATVMEWVREAVYEDFVTLTRFNHSSIIPGPIIDLIGSALITSGPEKPTTSTNFIMQIPVFLNNGTTRLNLQTFTWPAVTAAVNAYYGLTHLKLYIPADGFMAPPYNPWNSTALAMLQGELIEGLIRILHWGTPDKYGVDGLASSYAYVGAVTAANRNVSVDVLVPYNVASNQTTNTILNKLFNSPQAIIFDEAEAFIDWYNGYRTFDLHFPIPMPLAENGGEWPINNATVMGQLAQLLVANLTKMTNGVLATDFKFVASNATVATTHGVSYTLLEGNGTDAIILHGVIRGPIENSTTTALLRANYFFNGFGNSSNASHVIMPTTAYQKALSDAIVAYNADAPINIHFEEGKYIPFVNYTVMAPIMAAFGADITNYFGPSPLAACCVSANTNTYAISPNPQYPYGDVTFDGVIPGSYHNASTNADFASRDMSTTSFIKTLEAFAFAARDVPIQIYFELDGYTAATGSGAAAKPAKALNFPVNNATAIAEVIIKDGLARDLAEFTGMPLATFGAGVPSFVVHAVTVAGTGGGASTTKYFVALNATISCLVFNDTTNAELKNRTDDIAVIAAANPTLGASTATMVNAVAASFPHLADALKEYYRTKVIRVAFTPAGNIPLYVDPFEPPVPTVTFGASTTTTAALPPDPSASSTTAPAPTTRMGYVYEALYKDAMAIVVGEIPYPTDPAIAGAPLVKVKTIADSPLTYDLSFETLNNTAGNGIVVPTVYLKISVPGPYYNDTTIMRVTDGLYDNVMRLVNETAEHEVSFSHIGQWPFNDAARMALLRELLVEDAMDYFNYTGEFLSLSSTKGPVIVNATPATSTDPGNVGSITWTFNVPIVAIAIGNPYRMNLQSYGFPKTRAALDAIPNNNVTPWRGLAPEPAFFGTGCGKGCVIGIAVAVAVVLAVIAVIIVLCVSKRKRRADVVSPNFNPVMMGKIDIE